jgi:F5/8 type C domain
MKWFFCWSQDSEFRHDHDWKNLIRAAVESARRNTSLEPHFIYDGENSAFIEELRGRGVSVHFHRVSFAEQLAQHNPDPGWQAVARGAFLRFDIPLLADPADEFALYTDADVIFRQNPDLRGYHPLFLAAAPQFDRGRKADLNSGVMLLNLKTFRAVHSKLTEFTVQNLHLGLDQEVLRQFVGQDYLLLPDIFNWKPYWGVNADAPIIHWHGPKPATIGGLLDGTVTATHEAWQTLFERDRPAYAHYLDLHHQALASYNTPARADIISRFKSATQSSHCSWSFAPSREEDAAGGVNGVLDGMRKFHTDIEDNPWWQIDLGGIATITEIHVHNTTEASQDRFRDFAIGVSIDGNSWVDVLDKRDGAAVTEPVVWAGPGTAWARFVRVTLHGRDYLHLNQVEVFGSMP